MKLTLPKSEIDKFNKDVDKGVKKITDKASRILVDEVVKAHGQMRRNILVDTGRARYSTLFKFKRAGNKVEEATIGTYVKYAVFIERYKAYFKPAIERAARNLKSRFKNIIK